MSHIIVSSFSPVAILIASSLSSAALSVVTTTEYVVPGASLIGLLNSIVYIPAYCV